MICVSNELKRAAPCSLIRIFKDKKVFTKKIGIGTLLVSIGILVMPIINLISHSELGYYIGLILIVVGVFYIIFIIVKYNGKLISFKK